MPYFDQITQDDIDYIFKDKPYVAPVDIREQFYADLAGRKEGLYRQLQQESNMGVDDTYQATLQSALAERDEALTKQAYIDLANAPVESAQDVIGEYQAKIQNKPLTMRDYYYEQQGQTGKTDLDAARALLTNTVASMSDDLASALGGFARSLAPLTLAWASQAAKDVTGEQSYLFGNAVQALANHIYYSTDRVKAAEDVIQSVRKHSGLLGENDFDVASTLDLVFNYVDRIDQGTTEGFGAKFENFMLNTFAVVDFVPAWLPGINNTVKTAKANTVMAPLGKGLDTPLGDLAAHDKPLGDAMASAALQEPSGQAAQVLGVSKEQLAINSNPGFEVDGLRVAGVDATQEISENARIAMQTAADITPASLAQFLKVQSPEEQLAALTPKLQLGGYKPDMTLSVLHPPKDGYYRLGAVYGKGDGSAYGTLDEAQRALTELTATQAGNTAIEGVGIVQRVGTGNTWVKAGSTSETATEFKLEVTVRQPMRLDSDHVIPNEAITPSIFGTKYFQNLHATFASDYTQALVVSNEKAAKLQSDLLKISEPLSKLPELKKGKVLQAIIDGGEQEKVFNSVELESLYKMDRDQILAYQSERTLWDTIYQIKNSQERELRLADGYVRVQHDIQGDLDFMAKPVELTNYPTLKAARLIDGGMVGRTDMESYIQQGYSLFKTATPEEYVSGQRYSFILARADKHVKELPRRVLPYREGYYYKINKGKYFVEKQFKGSVDGVEGSFTRAVAIADSPAAAQKLVDAGVGDTFKVDENIVNNHDFANWVELNTPSTGYWYSRRNPQMPTYTINLKGELQQVPSKAEDPLVSAERAAAKVSNFVAWRSTMSVYNQIHKNTYPELWTHDGTKSLYLGLTSADNTPRVRAANAMFEHMSSLTNYSSQVDATWNNFMVSVDRLFSNHRLGGHTSKLFLDAGVKANPARVLTTGTYYTQVVSAPFRQFALNVLTPTLFAGYSPKTWVKSIKEAYLVYAKLTGGHLPLRSVQVDQAIRSATKELPGVDETVRQFVSTGKLETIDSHAMAHNEMLRMFEGGPSNSFTAAARVAVKPLKKGVNYVKEQGVVKGELFNKVFSFVFAKNLVMKDLKGKAVSEKLLLEQISTKTNQLGLDMTKVGAYGYQQGITRPLTQYLGVIHQVMATLIPPIPGVIRGNRAYDGKRAAVLLGLFALWGAQGLPFSPDELINGYVQEALSAAGVDLSVLDQGAAYALKEIVLRGALGASFAEAIRLATGQEATVTSEFSATFSPAAAGANPFYERFVTAEGNLLKLMSGPSATLINNVSNAAEGTRLLLYGYDTEELTSEKLKDIAVTWASILPSVSNAMRTRAALNYENEVDRYYTFSKKDVKLNSNLGELLVKGFLGISPQSDETFFSLIESNKASQESLQQDVGVLKSLWLRIATDEALTYEQKLSKIANISTVVSDNSLYNNAVLDQLRVELANDESLYPVVNQFITSKILDTPNKALDETKRELKAFFLGHPLLPKAEQDKIIQLVESQANDAANALKLLEIDTDATTSRP